MNKKLMIPLILVSLYANLHAIVPKYYGARTLGLGYGSTAFSYDVNMVFNNPALLTTVPFIMSSYQYQHSFRSSPGFYDTLNSVLGENLSAYDTFTSEKKNAIWNDIQSLYSHQSGLYGFQSHNPGYIGKSYGFAVTFEHESVMSPISSDLLTKSADQVTGNDLNTLMMGFFGLNYTRYSLSYALPLSRELNFGITVHYLSGKVRHFQSALTDSTRFGFDQSVRTYLEQGWQDGTDKFSKLTIDLAANMSIGRHFRVGAIIRNYGDPEISYGEQKLELKQRITGGIVFRPSQDLGVYLDVDLTKKPLVYNGEEMQPISIGIEKGFFANRFFIRAGMTGDLAAKRFLGEKSTALYGLGLGFNMKTVIVDLAMGINSEGIIDNLAASALFIVQ